MIRYFLIGAAFEGEYFTRIVFLQCIYRGLAQQKADCK